MRVWWRHVALDGAIVGAWLASVGMVVLHERGTLLGEMARPTASIGATLEAKEQWFSLSYQGQPIGWSQLQLVPGERHGMPGVEIVDYGHLAFTLLGTPQQLDVAARAFIDADWRLQEFEASVHSPAYQLRWTGRRVGDALQMSVSTPMSTITKRLSDSSGSAFVNGLSSWAAFRRLRVGQSGRVWVLNPMALDPETVYFTVRRRETLEGRDVLVVESDVSGLTTTSWVTPDGEVMKELAPMGWELRRVSRQEALRPQSPDAPAVDLLSATAVPVDLPIDDPTRLVRLTLLVEGVGAEVIGVQRPWQQLLPAERLSDYHRPPPEGRWFLVQMLRPRAPTGGPDNTVIPRAVARYRRPSPFVQSDDPRVSAQASRIVGTLSAPWDRVIALNRWVFSTLRKRLTVGLPSALDVLFLLEGDCHEHTVLMTAFSRSLGIPTRMVAGLVYQGGRFYYHAWPEVWIGGSWIPTDPTLGQPIADLTHLGLLEADNESLTALGQFIGKLKIDVVEME